MTIILASLASSACSSSHQPTTPDFVTIKDGKFHIGDTVYNYVGTNFW